jgi:hypothetical protein
MELEEVQNLWSAQNEQTLYKINADELHRRILSRKAKTMYTANFTELLLIGVNLGAGCFILWSNATNHHFFVYVLAVWMFVVAVLMVISRIRRIISGRRFDRSVKGELQHALAVAGYQVRLSQLMRWNNFVICGLVLFVLWESGKPLWLSGCVLALFLMAWYVGRFENRIYKARKARLEELQQQLID